MLTVTYHAGQNDRPRIATVDADPGTDHDTLARIIAIYMTGDAKVRHVLTIDNVEEAPSSDTCPIHGADCEAWA